MTNVEIVYGNYIFSFVNKKKIYIYPTFVNTILLGVFTIR